MTVKHGRPCARCSGPVRVDHADVDVAHKLLARGAARRYAAAQDLAREESYSAAVHDAQDADNGLWGTC